MKEFQIGTLLLLALGVSACVPAKARETVAPPPTITPAPRATINLKECLPSIFARYPIGSFSRQYEGSAFLGRGNTRVVNLATSDGTVAFVIPAPEKYNDSAIGVLINPEEGMGVEDGFVVHNTCEATKVTAALRDQKNKGIVWANTKAGLWDVLEGRELAEKLAKRISVFEVKWDRPAVQIPLSMRIAK